MAVIAYWSISIACALVLGLISLIFRLFLLVDDFNNVFQPRMDLNEHIREELVTFRLMILKWS